MGNLGTGSFHLGTGSFRVISPAAADRPRMGHLGTGSFQPMTARRVMMG